MAEHDVAETKGAAPDEPPEGAGADRPRKSAAGTVAIGILMSRVFGLVRIQSIAYFFGVGAHADVLDAAFRIPNLLQNLLGEGTISAAFIPVYSRMLGEGREQAAGRFAGAIFGLILAASAVLVLVGVLLAEPIAAALAPGWLNDATLVAEGTLPINRYELTVQAIRVTFPMVGVLVLFAWALGILNSHRRFLLPYIAPTLFNIVIIGALVGGAYYFAGQLGAVEQYTAATRTNLVIAACVGGLVGGLVQFLTLVPAVVQVLKGFRVSLSTKVEGVMESLRASGPAIAGRGVAQFSSYLDLLLASLLAAGAVSSLRFGLQLYLLPVSLFGMAVAAAELPELSRLTGDRVNRFLERLRRALRQAAFLTIPTVVGYLAFGFLIVSLLFGFGSFSTADAWLVYFILGGYSIGILATTLSRLMQNAFYAISDTKTPAKIAAIRVGVSTLVAVAIMFQLDAVSVREVVGDVGPQAGALFLGAVGLSLGATAGAWTEFVLLYRAMRVKVPGVSIPWGPISRMAGVALTASAGAAALWWAVPAWSVFAVAPLVTGTFAALYLGVAALLGFPEMDAWLSRFRRS